LKMGGGGCVALRFLSGRDFHLLLVRTLRRTFRRLLAIRGTSAITLLLAVFPGVRARLYNIAPSAL
jgi:hypothetical protein